MVGHCGGAMKDRSNYAGFFDSRFRSFGFGIKGRDAGGNFVALFAFVQLLQRVGVKIVKSAS